MGVADFPLNDGGMFYTMTEEIKSSNFKMPYYTSYNGALIPFAYPPLSFYIVASISSVFSVPLITLFYLLPLLVSLLTVPAFYLVAKSLVGGKMQSFLLLFSYSYQEVSSGLSREAGLQGHSDFFLHYLVSILEQGFLRNLIKPISA